MDFRESIVPHLIRNKVVDFPNQVWSIDTTYIPIGCGNMYLTAIIDWFSRKIMGWTLSDTLDTALVLDTVKEAVGQYGVSAIINSDQGVSLQTVSTRISFTSMESVRAWMANPDGWTT